MQGGLTKFRILFHCLLDGGQFILSQRAEALFIIAIGLFFPFRVQPFPFQSVQSANS